MRDKVTARDKAIIFEQSTETLVKWVLMLNRFDWPGELPDEEKPYRPTFVGGIRLSSICNTRGHQLIEHIQKVVGWRYILRRASVWKDETDQEFEAFVAASEDL